MKNNIKNTPETWRPWLGADYNARVFALTVQRNAQGGDPISPVEYLRELIDLAQASAARELAEQVTQSNPPN